MKVSTPFRSEGLRILVVEDTPTELKLVRHVLTSAGHFVQSAGAAWEAIEAIKQNKPQLILLDLALPGVDGLSLARMLKADPETSDITIVAITSFPEKVYEKDRTERGLRGFFG